MCDYEEFDDTLIDFNWYKHYGTPEVNADASRVPCGGCGALLHCKDPAIPGIWPGLKSIMHPFTPIFLVGNKIDLLPRDQTNFLDHVKQVLVDTVIDVTSVKKENITHVQLTSAITGYGVEQLINKLQSKWQHKGDVYLIGCTNVGKSSLFNALINSDYCKVQAIDLVQRATVSAWPGTTLNLLKFPILNPTGKKLSLRAERLKGERFYRMELSKYRDYQFKRTGNLKFAMFEDHVGRTYTVNSVKNEESDPFSEKSHTVMLKKPVLDESRPEFESSRWCYDTPGAMQADQILDLLTTDELSLTLPQHIISPRTFKLDPKQTMFVAGIGRLDYLEGEYFIRCTLFTSTELPVTMCYTTDADEVYERLLETEAFVVPKNDPERLRVWPKLGSKEIRVTGIRRESGADVVLSSAGWVAITPQAKDNVLLRVWTPQARGIHLRCPALLKKSVLLCGARIRGTPLYSPGIQVKMSG
ncbi:unnamed protein product [Xylocopa violacea]|uniref:G domain-containing protein n=1 Tax=Xylocopa violacea TaxID=135666 RepID=A0ABP1PHU1_XYLVO